MKSFNKSNKAKVSLKGFNNEIIEKLNNIDGKIIEECCCDCCKCCEPCESNPFIYFYSQYEIIEKLKTTVTVQDLFHLHEQFGFRFRFKGENPGQVIEPLYFQELQGTSINTNLLGELQANSQNAQFNPKIHQFIQELSDTYELTYATVLSKVDNTAQIFFIKGTGTNGKEGSIKNSLLEIYELLCEFDKNKLIEHSQVLDVSIDNCDDVYDFVITCTININNFKFNPETKTVK